MAKLAFISDIHYYSPSLGVSGGAYERRSGSDQKALGESREILRAALRYIESEKPDALVIPGDVTNDGERCSHREFREIIREFNEKIPVFLITSTHDWCSDNNPRRYEGDEIIRDVPVITRGELDSYYSFCGSEYLVSEFKTSAGFHSRAYDIKDVRLLALNDDCDGDGGASGYSPAHLGWIDEMIAGAREKGLFPIAFHHHLLLPSVHPLINSGQMIKDAEKTAGRFAGAGLKMTVAGHSHMQRTKEYVSPSGDRLTQINMGALCGHPAPVMFADTDGGSVKCRVEFLGEKAGENGFGTGFFINKTSEVIFNLIGAAASDREDFYKRLGADGIKLPDTALVYYPVRTAARAIGKMKTVTAGRIINAVTFGRGIGRGVLPGLGDTPLLQTARQVFLCVFDGSETAGQMSAQLKRAVCGAAETPYKIIKRLPGSVSTGKARGITESIGEIAGLLLYPEKSNREFEVFK